MAVVNNDKILKQHIEFINGRTGSGKTEYIVDLISKTKTENYIVVTPSKELANEIQKRLVSSGIPKKEINVIHQDRVRNPSASLSRSMEGNAHRVIITTQMSLIHAMRTDIIINKNNWNLILDEDFSPIHERSLYFTKNTIDIFDKAYKIVDSTLHKDLVEIVKHENSSFDANSPDTFLESQTAKAFDDFVTSSLFKVVTTRKHVESFRKFVDEISDNRNNFVGRSFYSVSFIDVNFFKSFKSVLVSSSLYEASLSGIILEKLGLGIFQRDVEEEPYNVGEDMKYNHVTINYYVEKDWSNCYKSREIDGKTLENIVYQRATSNIGHARYIFNANKNFRKSSPNGTLVTSIHGINTHIKQVNALYMPALNAGADLVRVLNVLGITRAEIDFDRNVLSAYQFVSRTAIRDPKNTRPISLHVTDKRTAQFLSLLYKGSKILFHQTERKREVVSNADKSFMARVRGFARRGETMRPSTIEKFFKIAKEQYDGNTKLTESEERFLKNQLAQSKLSKKTNVVKSKKDAKAVEVQEVVERIEEPKNITSVVVQVPIGERRKSTSSKLLTKKTKASKRRKSRVLTS